MDEVMVISEALGLALGAAVRRQELKDPYRVLIDAEIAAAALLDGKSVTVSPDGEHIIIKEVPPQPEPDENCS